MMEYQQSKTYFAEELESIHERYLECSLGKIYCICAGTVGQPLIIIVHGSGPKNSSEQYKQLLQQYLVRISYLEKFYIVGIDCPGYGKSVGKGRQAIKTFPLQLFRQILQELNYKSYFGMYGHSQGGAAIFNAVFEDPSLTEFMIMDRPVCGNIQRFNGFEVPTLLVYDVEDDGHPIWQGKLLFKVLKTSQLYTYKGSRQPYWVPDHIWDHMLHFFSKCRSKNTKQNRLNSRTSSRNHYSQPKNNSRSNSYQLRSQSIGKPSEIKKQHKRTNMLFEVQERDQSEIYSLINQQQIIERNREIEGPKIQMTKEQAKLEQLNNISKLQKSSKLLKQQQIQRSENVKQIEIEIKQQKHQTKQQIDKKIQQAKLDNRCTICFQSYFLPVVTNCNHLFCKKCISQYLLIDQRCPLCRGKVTKTTLNKQIHELNLRNEPQSYINKRQIQYNRFQKMLNSIVYIEVGNTSQELITKKSAFRQTKKKYIWCLYVSKHKYFEFQEVLFNINMGDRYGKPIAVKNHPYVFESRGTFSFSCQITIKPKNKQYADLVVIYRINVQPGTHKKIVALKKKCYM